MGKVFLLTNIRIECINAFAIAYHSIKFRVDAEISSSIWNTTPIYRIVHTKYVAYGSEILLRPSRQKKPAAGIIGKRHCKRPEMS